MASGDKAVRPDHGDGGVMQCKPAFEAVLRIAHPQRAGGVILLAMDLHLGHHRIKRTPIARQRAICPASSPTAGCSPSR